MLLSADEEGWREVKGWKQEKQVGGFEGVALEEFEREGVSEGIRGRGRGRESVL